MNLAVRSAIVKYRMLLIVKTIACTLILVQPACHIPALNQAESAPVVPAGYTVPSPPPEKGAKTNENDPNTGDNSAQLTVEEFYNDPVLTKLIEQAVTGNRELKILDQEILVSRNEILSRSGAYQPFVTAGGGLGVDKSSAYTRDGAVDDQLLINGQSIPSLLPNYAGSFNFFWQLDVWRQLRNARDAAQQRYIAAIERRSYFVTKMVAEIAENYYRLMALDQRIETLDATISIQENSLGAAKRFLDAGQGTALGVQRFQAEVRKNQSEKLLVKQEIIETENRINTILNRYPEPVERMSAGFLDLTIHKLSVGLPAQLLQNRPDIRQAEREIAASGLDVLVARAKFYPTFAINAAVGYSAMNPSYFFATPEALVASVAGGLVAPLINKKAIQAEYMTANARQLEAIYNYQRLIVNAFTEVVNRVSMAENYRRSVEIKRQQLEALSTSVTLATQLFLARRVEYLEVLVAQRDLNEAKLVLIQTKKDQLSAIVNAYQALGGGDVLSTVIRPTPQVIIPPSQVQGQLIPPAQGPGQMIPPGQGPAPGPMPGVGQPPAPAPMPGGAGGNAPAPAPGPMPGAAGGNVPAPAPAPAPGPIPGAAGGNVPAPAPAPGPGVNLLPLPAVPVPPAPLPALPK